MITKNRYIELMEKALSAYTDEHIKSYFEQVKAEGLKEHGFPRLTVCIGILAAHGKRKYLFPLFLEMMEFCCKTIPNVKAANDFSVREIITCIIELEKLGTVDKETIDRWKGYLTDIDPAKCYNVYAKELTDDVYNWALFTGVSEFLRQHIGLNRTEDFVDTQIASQLAHLDRLLMYKDAPNHPPMVYDLVSRALFSILLHFGYKGKYFKEIDECLRKTGLLTLKMQSVSGEIPYGGRSNQFLHNEGLLLMIYEFEANRYAREGNLTLASQFKAALKSAFAVIEHWFSKSPIHHVKNRFPLETRYGCEEYGYFDKYMITTASWFFVAYLMCDEAIPCGELDGSPEIFITSDEFNKLFMRSGEYFLEFDIDANLHYDTNGLGRIHKKGAPSPICLSLPCPTPSKAHYIMNVENAEAMSLCPAVFEGDLPIFAVEQNAMYKIKDTRVTDGSAYALIDHEFESGKHVAASYNANSNGVEISVSGGGKIGYALPAFMFDGEKHTEITHNGNTVTVAYEGWMCKYTTDGKIIDSGKKAYNRNGHYKVFYAEANKDLSVKIEIFKI